MDYYRITPDFKDHELWRLSKLNDLYPGRFTAPGRLENVPAGLEFELAAAGVPADFGFAEFEVPFCNARVAEALSPFEVQLVPVGVQGMEERFFIVVALEEVDCVDEEKSEFMVWEEGNDIRPEHAGDYRAFRLLLVDPDRTGGAHVFRLARFHAGLVVSDRVKLALDALDVRGVSYQLVTEAPED